MLKQKTVYFREEDLPLWEKIGNKAEWLHLHLTDLQRVKNATAQIQQEAVRLSMTPTPIFHCKNNHSIPEGRDKCLGKGCKYS